MIRKRRRRTDDSEVDRRVSRHSEKHHDEQKENTMCGHHMDALPSTSTEIVQKVPFGCATRQLVAGLPMGLDDVFHFEELPQHIRDSILGYFSLRKRVQLERVCRSWRQILLASWRRVTKITIPATITEEMHIRPINDSHVCGLLHKCGRYLQEVDLFVPHFTIGQHILYSISQLCVNLRRLVLRTDIDGQAMTFLLKNYADMFSQLTSFEICYHNIHSIHNGLRAVSRTLTEVECFRLECFSLPTNIAALFPNSPNMRKFTIKQLQLSPGRNEPRVCSSFVGDFFSYLGDVYPLLEELEVSILAQSIADEERLRYQLGRIGSLRKIRRLNLRLVSCGEWWGTFSLRSLSSFTHLRELSLTACQLPYDLAAILTAAGMQDTLQTLKLSIIGHLDPSRLIEICSALPHLRQLALRYSAEFPAPLQINVSAFISIFMFCHRLSSLELVECPGVERVALVHAMHSAFHDSLQCDENDLSPTVTLRLVCNGPTCSARRRRAGGVKCCGKSSLKDGVYSCVINRVCRKRKPTLAQLSSTEQSSSD